MNQNIPNHKSSTGNKAIRDLIIIALATLCGWILIHLHNSHEEYFQWVKQYERRP